MGKYALEEKHGKKAEDRFEELAIDSGYEVTQSSNYDNMFKEEMVGYMVKLTK